MFDFINTMNTIFKRGRKIDGLPGYVLIESFDWLSDTVSVEVVVALKDTSIKPGEYVEIEPKWFVRVKNGGIE